MDRVLTVSVDSLWYETWELCVSVMCCPDCTVMAHNPNKGQLSFFSSRLSTDSSYTCSTRNLRLCVSSLQSNSLFFCWYFKTELIDLCFLGVYSEQYCRGLSTSGFLIDIIQSSFCSRELKATNTFQTREKDVCMHSCVCICVFLWESIYMCFYMYMFVYKCENV